MVDTEDFKKKFADALRSPVEREAYTPEAFFQEDGNQYGQSWHKLTDEAIRLLAGEAVKVLKEMQGE